MAKDLKIGENAKITIEWKVLPVDFSKEKEESIRENVAKKYGVPSKNVEIVPVFISLNNKGEKIALTNDTIQNIQDPKFQQQLFQAYLDENNIEDYDFNEIIKIDSQINSLIDYEVYDKFKRYEIKWLKWSNFLSYGDDNFFDFTTLNGLVLLNGEPANQSGKSTFAYDLLHFVLFGKTTSGKADDLAGIFNRYRPETTEVKVEGCIEIDGEDYIIRRTLTRPAHKRRTAKSKVTQKVEYFKVVNGEEQALDDVENMEGENNVQTTKIIKEAIGNEKDFDLVICANSDNLKSLISLKDTERGRLLSKWIGLLPLEEKDAIAREKWNKEISKSLLSNIYSREVLKTEIDAFNLSIKDNIKRIDETKVKYADSTKRCDELAKQKEALLSAKREVDSSLTKVDVHTIERQIEDVTEKGKQTKALMDKTKNDLDAIANVEFSENEYQDLQNQRENIAVEINGIKNTIRQLRETNKNLAASEYCPTCKRKLEGVDYSATIAGNEEKIKTLISDGEKKNGKLNEIKENIVKMDENRRLFNEKSRLSILIDKYDADLKVLRLKLKDFRQTMKALEDNKAVIEANNKIENSLNVLNVSLKTEEGIRDNLLLQINGLENENKTLQDNIKNRENIISQIDNEEKIVKTWKIYLTLVGKNGIGKMADMQEIQQIVQV
mgnify:CR=1 FL=1